MYCLKIQMVNCIITSNYSKNKKLNISSSFFVQSYFHNFKLAKKNKIKQNKTKKTNRFIT